MKRQISFIHVARESNHGYLTNLDAPEAHGCTRVQARDGLFDISLNIERFFKDLTRTKDQNNRQ